MEAAEETNKITEERTSFLTKICIYLQTYKKLWRMTYIHKLKKTNYKNMKTLKGESMLELTYKNLLAKKAGDSQTGTHSKFASHIVTCSEIHVKK